MSTDIILNLNLIQLLLITACMILGAALQASAGFGSGLVAVPTLSLIDPVLVPGPVLFAYIFLTSLMAWKERNSLSLFHSGNICIGLAIGSVLSVVALVNIDRQYFPLIAALFVFAGISLSLIHKPINLSVLNLNLAGIVAGVMNTLAGLSGPALALPLQHQSASFVRANLGLIFVFASLFSITALYSTGNFGLNDIYLGLCMVPGIFIGYLVGQPVSKRINQKQSRYAILTISSLSALSLVLKTLL